MKMHVAFAAALAALGSHAALAASEGGDTWSEVQPKPFARSTQPLTVPAPVPVSNLQHAYLHGAPGGSEGGDTWSEVQPQPYARWTQSPEVATIAPWSSLQHETSTVNGTPAQADSVDRIVRLGPESRWMDVAYGETVKFIVNGEDGAERSFVRRFDVSPAVSHVDLSDVAPADLSAQKGTFVLTDQSNSVRPDNVVIAAIPVPKENFSFGRSEAQLAGTPPRWRQTG